MNAGLLFCIRCFAVVLLVSAAGLDACAQVWLPGYNFRKAITIDKSFIPGASNLRDFNVLVKLDVPGLKQMLRCGDVPERTDALPIAFATKEQPGSPLSFQLDSYDPLTGKLHCWVRISALISVNNPGKNELYFYYGGKEVHDPLSEENVAIWSDSFRRVWHMNFDAAPATSFSANLNGPNAIGNAGMSAANFVPGIIGAATVFNGITDDMHAVRDEEKNIYISVWVKPAEIGREQVILANDSVGNGYQLKLNAQGNVVFDLLDKGALNRHTATEVLTINSWNYLTIFFVNNQKKIYINGKYKGGGGVSASTGTAGGALNIGKSKQNDRHFNGTIDELRIGGAERSVDWILTEYLNQLNPESFLRVSDTEVNPVQYGNPNRFTGARTNDWYDEHNWSLGRLPDRYTDVVISAGKDARVNTGHAAQLNGLLLEPGATLTLEGELEADCTVHLAPSSSIRLGEAAQLRLKNDLLNDGTISSGQDGGVLIFNGIQPLQVVSGAGIITVAQLQVNLSSSVATLLLRAQIHLSRRLMLSNGILNANGQLTLLAAGYHNYASVMPFEPDQRAQVIGNVNVQQFIDGNFPDPSTARGWRLLSAPVYHAVNALKTYHLDAIQQSIFVTGLGGTLNGFDLSPNNNATIYTHDQALPGTLSHKYTGITRMDTTIPLGKGLFVFSRGSRLEPYAYEHQVEKPPFSNPPPYVITYKGMLFAGELKMEVFNRQTGAAGDGYNLLGNPYAAPISWGSLQKSNVSPFVWVFDPKNNAYFVTDDPQYILHAGTGFFVKVHSDKGLGTVTFTESAKSVASVNTLSKTGSIPESLRQTPPVTTKVKIGINKDGLSDHYTLVLKKEGNDDVTDADALKIGEGYLSISGLAGKEQKLAIDERELKPDTHTVRIFVKGWANGVYTLNLTASLNNGENVTLLDHYLDKQVPIGQEECRYTFTIDMEKGASYGTKRFALRIEPPGKAKPINAPADLPVLCYPNPVHDLLYIRSAGQTWRNLKVLIRAMSGRIVWSGELPVLDPAVPAQLPCAQLIKGLYILQLIDQQTNRTLNTVKILKN